MTVAFMSSPTLPTPKPQRAQSKDSLVQPRRQQRPSPRLPAHPRSQHRTRPPKPSPSPSPSSGIPSVNDELTATVSSIVSFGAFVKLSTGHTGLVHISEIADKFISSVHDHIAVGDVVNVRVIAVDPKSSKISLSLRQSLSAQSTGYQRVVDLGGDWGHPWNDDGDTNFIDFPTTPQPRPHLWEPDLSLFEDFDINDDDDDGNDDNAGPSSQQTPPS